MALVAQEPAANILPFAIMHLTLVDQPFVDFYAAFDQYKVDYARWQSLQPVPAATGVGGVTPSPQSTLSATGAPNGGTRS